MKDNSERLISLLRGQRVDQPPLWDPWFAMTGFLRERYEGDYLAMAEHLGHAAVPIGIVRTTVDCFDHDHLHSAGRGVMRHSRQRLDEPDPHWATQMKNAQAGRAACHEVGVACWMTMKWSFDAIVSALGYEEFALACYDEPDRLAAVIDCMESRNQLAVEHVISKVKPDFVLFEGNCAYQTGPMIDPSLMGQLCTDPTRRTLGRLADADIPAVIHTEGRIDDLIPMFIEFGFIGVQGCDPQANDLADLVDRFGGQIALCGNMDVSLLATGTPQEITQCTKAMLDIGRTCGRFAAGANTVVQDDTPVENYLAMVRAVTHYEDAMAA